MLIQGSWRSLLSVFCGVVIGISHTYAVDEQPVDFNGVWVMADVSLVVVPEENSDNLTAEAKKRIENYTNHYDPAMDDPAYFCLAKGMPWTMLNRARGYPLEIYQTKDRVVVFFELYDAYRQVRLDQDSFPENIVPSGNGYSIGRWSGDVLEIDTRGLTATNSVSHVHRTEDMFVREHWALSSDQKFGDTLVIDMSIEDPAIFKTAARAKMVMKRASEGTRVGGYNCPESLWDSHIEKRSQELSSTE